MPDQITDEGLQAGQGKPAPSKSTAVLPAVQPKLRLHSPQYPELPTSTRSVATHVERAQMLAREVDALSARPEGGTLFDVLDHLKKRLGQTGENGAVQLLDQMRSSVASVTTGAESDTVFRTQAGESFVGQKFFEAQRDLALNHRIFVNAPTGGFNFSIRVAAVEEVINYTSKCNTPASVIMIDAEDNSGLYGKFQPPDVVIVNRRSAERAPGDDPLKAVVANELAHLYLNKHNFPSDPGRQIALDKLSLGPLSPDSPEGKLLLNLRRRGSASSQMLHELYSDCWSTQESPSFDQARHLNRLLSHASLRAALNELGKPTSSHQYDLVTDLFADLVKDTLKAAGKVDVYQATVEQLTRCQRLCIVLDDRIKEEKDGAKLATLQTDRTAIIERYRVILSDGLKIIPYALGSEGLEKQRQAFAACALALEDLFSTQAGSKVHPGWTQVNR